ncbi:MAG: 23S rRNA (uracil(1939)-C(5))-methyltransferase RlmD, partial [Calditrichaeota bacterium]|nr:23S rRNA (uracil(1939)-C(5))-methyltransferase RlmD [Calditrichota bacterium]
RLGKWRFRVYPNTFFQVNTVQMLKMLERLKTELLLNSEDRVFDLYCGVGAIALSVAEQVREVIGIESNVEAIAAAEENARDNRLSNLQFICGDAADAMATQLAAGHAPDVVIADPPRKGLPESLIEQIATVNPRSVAYFSCNPKTLVRDLAIFRQNGYAATDIFPFDMFPQTYHVECLTVLQKSK